MLVGDGARQWAIDNNLEEVDDDYHKTGWYFWNSIIKNCD